MDVFDRIIAGEIPCYKLFEDEYCISFLDIAPIKKGHSLVVAKKSVATIDELSDKEIAQIFSVVRRLDIKMRKELHCDALNIFINDGKASGQEVPHVHIHLLPRFSGDGGFEISKKEKYMQGEAEKLCELLKL